MFMFCEKVLKLPFVKCLCIYPQQTEKLHKCITHPICSPNQYRYRNISIKFNTRICAVKCGRRQLLHSKLIEIEIYVNCRNIYRSLLALCIYLLHSKMLILLRSVGCSKCILSLCRLKYIYWGSGLMCKKHKKLLVQVVTLVI